MIKRGIIFILLAFVLVGLAYYAYTNRQSTPKVFNNLTDNANLEGDEGGFQNGYLPLSIDILRKGDYPGSEIIIEQTLGGGTNYDRYIASYKSEGLIIYALLTVPKGPKPEGGFPVIIFNHGYIPPSEYKTAERYVAYVEGFSQAGYIVF